MLNFKHKRRGELLSLGHCSKQDSTKLVLLYFVFIYSVIYILYSILNYFYYLQLFPTI